MNILTGLCAKSTMGQGGDIYVNNLYTIKQYDQLFPGANDLILQMNLVIDTITGLAQNTCPSSVKIHVADVYSAFQGQQDALLIDLYLRNGINYPDIHPTNKGYQLMTHAYINAIRQGRPGHHHHWRDHEWHAARNSQEDRPSDM
jgi:hypothetical protein